MTKPILDDFNPAARRPGDFERPKPALKERLRQFLRRSALGLFIGPTYPRIIDVSHWNTIDNLTLVKASGVVGIIFKATEGVTFVDQLFLAKWREALDLGFFIGVYHFFRSNLSGINQADFYLENTRPLWEATQGHIMPGWMDVETADGVSVATRQVRVHDALLQVKAHRYASGVYSSPYMWSNLIGNVPWMQNFYGWDAHWTSAQTPILPVGWSDRMTKLWQAGVYPKHSWAYPVQGLQGEVDENYFMGSLGELRTWVGLDQAPTLEDRVAALEGRVAALEAKV